jgi:hypothetical protein
MSFAGEFMTGFEQITELLKNKDMFQMALVLMADQLSSLLPGLLGN